jgi:hypothetical protein
VAQYAVLGKLSRSAVEGIPYVVGIQSDLPLPFDAKSRFPIHY